METIKILLGIVIIAIGIFSPCIVYALWVMDKIKNIEEEETKDVQKAIKQLQQENKILKENAKHNDKVVDKVNWENMLLKKENQELKKQLEEYKDKINWYENFEVNKTIDKLRLKHNTKQKEFIKYLEDEIKRLKENDIYQPLQKMALATHEHTLQKYKSIIGGASNE